MAFSAVFTGTVSGSNVLGNSNWFCQKSITKLWTSGFVYIFVKVLNKNLESSAKNKDLTLIWTWPFSWR